MNWTDVWKKPFSTDGWGYIYSGNDVTAFSTSVRVDPESEPVVKLVNNILAALNDEEITEKYDNICIENGCDLYMDRKEVGCFRGWGYMRSPHCLNLSAAQAVELQDEMINYVMSKIKK